MPTAVALTRLAAYFGPVGGGPPDYANPPSEEWRVDGVDESDPRHPVAQLTRALPTFAVDRTSLFQTREVHIWTTDITKSVTDPDYRVTPLFWGEVTANTIKIRKGETETAVARVHGYHFGTPLEGEQVFDPIADPNATLIVHRDARFNPTIDARVLASMAKRVAQTGYPTDYNLWIDPESVRTDEAAKVHKQFTDPDIVVARWSLGLAVETLQRVLNANEDHIKNPTIFADPDVPEAPFDNAEQPQNVTLKRGMYLDECLTALLPQYGCGWYVKPTVDDSGGHATRFIQPELAYYQRGVGTEKDVKLQAPAAALDADATDCLQADITFDIANIVNRVVCHGAPIVREVTIELQRAWAESDDVLTASDLTRGEEDSQFEDKPHVHRKWVANEAGDYNGLRTEITEALDLSSVFPDGYVPKRRQLHPPLTYRNLSPTETEGIPGPVKVDFCTTGDAAVEEDWLDVTGGAANARFKVLPNEIGIYFNQPEPPSVLVGTDPADLRIRVTGTIVGDRCLTKTADVQAWAPTQTPITKLLDVGDRFFDRQRQTTGDHASVLTGDHDSRDDATALQTYADAMRDQEAAASVDARITISGIVTDYEISDLLTGISGRNISFNRSGDAGTPKYVQVVGRQFDGNNQTTTLIVKPYDVPAGGAA